MQRRTAIGFFVENSQIPSSAIAGLVQNQQSAARALFEPKQRIEYETKFLQHVVNGEVDAVKDMLEKDINLLFIRRTVTDLAGRKVYGTAFQIALCADDMNPYENPYSSSDMCRLIAKFFDRFPKGATIRYEQFIQKFPKGMPNDKSLLTDADFLNYIKEYENIIRAIANDPCIKGEVSESTQAIIDNIRGSSFKDAVKNGLHFDERIFLAALAVYDDPAIFRLFKNEDQRRVYCIQVLGSLQSLFTANFAQIFCFGLKTFAIEKKSLTRSLNFSDGTSFFDQNLGVSHFVFSYGWGNKSNYELGAPWSGNNTMSQPLAIYLHDKQKLRNCLIKEWKQASDQELQVYPVLSARS